MRGGEGLQTLGGLFSWRKKLQCWNGEGGNWKFHYSFCNHSARANDSKDGRVSQRGDLIHNFSQKTIIILFAKSCINLYKYCLDWNRFLDCNQFIKVLILSKLLPKIREKTCFTESRESGLYCNSTAWVEWIDRQTNSGVVSFVTRWLGLTTLHSSYQAGRYRQDNRKKERQEGGGGRGLVRWMDWWMHGSRKRVKYPVVIALGRHCSVPFAELMILAFEL